MPLPAVYDKWTGVIFFFRLGFRRPGPKAEDFRRGLRRSMVRPGPVLKVGHSAGRLETARLEVKMSEQAEALDTPLVIFF